MTARITTPYSAQTTSDDIVEGLDLTGQRVIVTGGASGIGTETAKSLAAAGAEITLAVRNLDAGEQVAAQLAEETGSKQVVARSLDLADQASVRSFVASWDGPLNVLINNAGLMAALLTRTPEGWEMQFATNHLGHFALTTGLHGALAAAARIAGQARVVSVSSSAHLGSGIVFDDIGFLVRDGIGGKYFEDCNEALPHEPGTRRGVAAHALDREAASRLWQVSAETVGA